MSKVMNRDEEVQDAICELHNKCDSLLAQCNIDMCKLIDDFNEKYEDDDEGPECDTVDLDSKFTELADYVEDYTNQ